MTEITLESGAEDLMFDPEATTILAGPGDFLAVKTGLEEAGLECLSAETGYMPQNTIALQSRDDARKVLKLIDNLEENEDVQSVYANYDIPSEWLDELG